MLRLDNVTVDDSACHNPRDFLAVGFKGRPKYGSVWTGTNWSHYLTGLGVVDLSGDVSRLVGSVVEVLAVLLVDLFLRKNKCIFKKI